MRSSSLG
jgi:hypothetical protein